MDTVTFITKNAENRAQFVSTFRERFILKRLRNRLTKKPNITILKGLRGVGKTTALLQLFNENKNSIYFSADHPLVKETGLFEICRRLISKGGYKILLIDETHYIPKWKESIKVIHDDNPNVKVILSGSSAIALHVLERRAIQLTLEPMSVSEYLHLSQNKLISAKSEWKKSRDSIKFVVQNEIESTYWKYLKYGGFPQILTMEEEDFNESLYMAILKSIREDSVNYLTLSQKKGNAMEELVNTIALSKPGEFSYTSISRKVGMSKSTIYEIVGILEKLSLMTFLRPYSRSTALLRAEPKLFFSHPNLRYVICSKLGVEPEIGAIREEYAAFHHCAVLRRKSCIPA